MDRELEIAKYLTKQMIGTSIRIGGNQYQRVLGGYMYAVHGSIRSNYIFIPMSEIVKDKSAFDYRVKFYICACCGEHFFREDEARECHNDYNELFE